MDKRWGEILEKDEMVQGMAEISDPEKFQEFLKAHGYDFTIEEIRAFGEELAEQYSEEAGGELTDNDLEDVADEVKDALNIVPVKNVTDVLEQCKLI